MDTNVNNINEGDFADIFPDLSGPKKSFLPPVDPISPKDEGNLLAPVDPKDLPGAADSEAAKADAAAKAAKEIAEGADTDILNNVKPADTTPSGTPIKGLEDYYSERLKTGKFVGIKELDAEGKEVDFIPKTAEDYDEVLELEFNHRLGKAKEEIQKSWYETKSPAWKAISQYAELTDDPTQLIPFLQGIKTIQSVADMDENQIEGAERIVRTRLEQKGDPETLITTQINSLKSTDQLIPAAKEYKPLILRQEQAQLAAMQKQKQQEEQQYGILINEIKTGTINTLNKPLFGGKIKLKQEDKAAIYDLIGEPAEETQGFAIYNKVDELFDKKDYETLSMLGLFLANKDAFFNYIGINIANQTAQKLERTLRVAGETHNTSGNDFHEEKREPAVMRSQFKPARFTTK